MGVLDDHNHQHTYGNHSGPSTSIVGVSAQQAIDANKRITESAEINYSSRSEIKWKDSLKLTLIFGSLGLILALIAYVIGGIGSIAIGLLAAISIFIGVIFLIITLIGLLKC